MTHPSYGSFTPEQIKQASQMGFGQTHKYLESLLEGRCEHCKKSYKDLPRHSDKCRHAPTK